MLLVYKKIQSISTTSPNCNVFIIMCYEWNGGKLYNFIFIHSYVLPIIKNKACLLSQNYSFLNRTHSIRTAGLKIYSITTNTTKQDLLSLKFKVLINSLKPSDAYMRR